MESIFFIKHVGDLSNISVKGEQLAKRTLVISTKECRVGDGGTYGIDQDFVIDLLGERATTFNLNVGEWLVGSVSFTAREYNGQYYPDVRLTRYCKL